MNFAIYNKFAEVVREHIGSFLLPKDTSVHKN